MKDYSCPECGYIWIESKKTRPTCPKCAYTGEYDEFSPMERHVILEENNENPDSDNNPDSNPTGC